jgi:hypothetical protein
MFSLALVAFAFAALFSIYSSAFPLLRTQQDTIAVTLCLDERLDRIRSLNWSILTNAERLRQDLAANGARSGVALANLVEDVTISPWPAPAVLPTPIHVTRWTNGTADTITQPTDSLLATGPSVRVDVRDTWQLKGRTHIRETSAIIASGGLLR